MLENDKQRTIRNELRQIGVTRSNNILLNPWKTSGLVIIAALVVMLVIGRYLKTEEIAQVGSILLAAGAFVIGLQQWKLSRAEIAFDKFYERLDIVNHRLDEWGAARDMVKQFWGENASDEEYQRRMYVYVELDNLEYATQKYKLGFMGIDDVYRELTLFRSRCASNEFKEYAIHQVEIAGYRRDTMAIVRNIIDNMQKTK